MRLEEISPAPHSCSHTNFTNSRSEAIAVVLIETSLLDGRRARPVLLRNGVGPCRTQWLQDEPGLHELLSLDPIRLHACPTAWLTGLGISPFARKAKPCAVPFE